MSLKIIDFGVSTWPDLQSEKRVRVGTVKFMAPEIFSNNYDPTSYTQYSDMWAVGIVLYILFSGSYPIDGRNLKEFIMNIMDQ